MRFLVFLVFSVLCACIRSAELQSLPQKDLFYLKEMADPDRAKPPHPNTPHMSTSRCGGKYLHNVHARKEGVVSVTQ